MLMLFVGESRTRVIVVRVGLRVQESLVRLVEMGNQLMRHRYGPQQVVDMYGLRCADHAGDLSVHSIDGVASAVQRMQHLPLRRSWTGLWLCWLLRPMWRSWTRRYGPRTWNLCLRCFLEIRRTGALRR